MRLGQSDENRRLCVLRSKRMENRSREPMYGQRQTVHVHVLFHRKLRFQLVHFGMAAGMYVVRLVSNFQKIDKSDNVPELREVILNRPCFSILRQTGCLLVLK